jgi:hypothetical protein
LGVTTNFGFPYPAATDAPDGPSQIEALAEAVDTELETVVAGGGWVSLTMLNGWSGTLQVKLTGTASAVAIRTLGTIAAPEGDLGLTIAVMDEAYWPAHAVRLPFIITAVGPGSEPSANDPYMAIDTTGDIGVSEVSTQVMTNGAVNSTYWLD